MKKTLALVLTLLMLVASFALFAVNASADDSFTWDPDTETITVLKDVEGEYGDGNDTFPWAAYRQDVVKVVVGDEVTKLAKAAFSGATLLEEVECGKKCSIIEMDAFAYNAALSTLIFHCPITSIGQGTVYSSPNIMEITLTNQTKEEFIALSKKRPYNTEYENEFITYHEVEDSSLIPPPTKDYEEIAVSPYYDQIENWPNDNGAVIQPAEGVRGTNTYLIVGGTDKEYCNRDALAGVKDEEGNITTPATTKLKVVITDETEGKTYTINEYAFDDPNAEIYSDGSFLRIAPELYGIHVVPGHGYTVYIEFTKDGKVIAKGESAKGTFNSDKKANGCFKDNGPITYANPPHTYAEAGGGEDVPPVDTGDNTAVIAVLAIVALLGTAVVVSKKVLSK